MAFLALLLFTLAEVDVMVAVAITAFCAGVMIHFGVKRREAIRKRAIMALEALKGLISWPPEKRISWVVQRFKVFLRPKPCNFLSGKICHDDRRKQMISSCIKIDDALKREKMFGCTLGGLDHAP